MAAVSMAPSTIILDPTSMSGPTRKPGNLWTVEAREDMFNRRESGEGWESICQDYPNRSRHAMQQQYSMMKKQRALENGTWTTNRRGRKRRMITSGAGEMSDDDMSEGSPERSNTMRLPPFSHIVGRSQPSYLRKTSDPMYPRHLPAINSSGLGPSSEGSSSLSPIPSLNSPDFKRQKTIDDRPASSQFGTSYDPWQPKLPDLVLTEGDLTALLQKGRDQAARMVDDINHRKEMMRQSKDDQISRYLAQLREVQDQLTLERGQGPYVQELNRRDQEIESLRGHIAGFQEALVARDNKVTQLEKENHDLKARLAEMSKRADTKMVATSSPPTTPITRRTSTPGNIASWDDAVNELSNRIDSASGVLSIVRSRVDKTSAGQVLSNIEELVAVMGSVMKERDRVIVAFNRIRLGDESTGR